MKKVSVILLFCFFLTTPLFATNIMSTNPLGKLSQSNVELDFNGEKVSTYTAFKSDYVPVSSLRSIGFPIDYDITSGKVVINSPSLISSPTSQALSFKNNSFALYESDVWIGDFKTHAIVSEDNVLIPIGALRQLYHIDITDTTYHMTPKEPLHIIANSNTITNNLPTPITVSLIDLYWDNGFIMQPSNYDLSPLETRSRTMNVLHDNKKYITTIIKQATGRELNYNNGSMFGQTNDLLFDYYTKLKYLDLSSLGDPIDFDTLIWAESTINSKNMSSKTKYLVWTNIDLQRTFIFEGSTGNWKLKKYFLCSTGKSSSPTPKGSYELTRKVPYFGVEKGYRCKNAFGFIGTTYLYHSVMFDKTGSYLLEGKGELGARASAGCIRLSVENSEWFYSNMLSGTKVFID